MKETETIQQILARRLRSGEMADDDRVRIRIPDAKRLLMEALVYYLQGRTQWLPEYDGVASWLEDNQGRGLFLIGNMGRGKTVMVRDVLPLIINRCAGKVVSYHRAAELNEYSSDNARRTVLRYDEIRRHKIIALDDVGTEPQACIYGETHDYFAELADDAEQRSRLLILTSNLDVAALRERYGDRTVDRLTGLTTRVYFQGGSLRR